MEIELEGDFNSCLLDYVNTHKEQYQKSSKTGLGLFSKKGMRL